MKSALPLVHNILSDNQRRDLIDYWNSNPRIEYEQSSDELAINMQQQVVPWDHPSIRAIKDYITSTDSLLNENDSYTLNYTKGSYMRHHLDNNTVHLTCVTLLGESPDLYGGVPFFVDEKDNRKIFSAHIKPGQSMIYPRYMRHGVSVIERGVRMVHVAWFGKS